MVKIPYYRGSVLTQLFKMYSYNFSYKTQTESKKYIKKLQKISLKYLNVNTS